MTSHKNKLPASQPCRYKIIERRRVYDGFYAVEEVTTEQETFSGGWSAPMKRVIMLTRNVVATLPWDIERDKVGLIRQFRTGVAMAMEIGMCPASDGSQAWQFEVPIGIVDPGEDKETAARRELYEETGLTAGRFHQIASCHPSAGSHTEIITSYIAETDLSKSGGIYGLQQEGEDIYFDVMTCDQAIDMLENGHIRHASAVICLQALAGLRAHINQQDSTKEEGQT